MVTVVVLSVAELGAGVALREAARVAVVGIRWRDRRVGRRDCRVGRWWNCSICTQVGRGHQAIHHHRAVERHNCRVDRRRNRSVCAASTHVGCVGRTVERLGHTIERRIVRACIGVVHIGGTSAVHCRVRRIRGVQASVLTRGAALIGGQRAVGRCRGFRIFVDDADPGNANLVAFAVIVVLAVVGQDGGTCPESQSQQGPDELFHLSYPSTRDGFLCC